MLHCQHSQVQILTLIHQQPSVKEWVQPWISWLMQECHQICAVRFRTYVKVVLTNIWLVIQTLIQWTLLMLLAEL
jgi:hypothetical protein